MIADYPFEPRPGEPGGESGRAARTRSLAAGIVTSLVILIGSALIGLAGGLAWTGFAPRAVYVVTGHGSANVVNPETSAFIAADAWYCLIGLAGGLVIGLGGYLLGVRRYGPAPMAAILIGGVLAGLAARLVGENHGLHQFNRQLLTTPHGTLLHAPLALAGDTSAAVWPPAASLPAVAFWPLGACAVAGGIVLIQVLRDRNAGAYRRRRRLRLGWLTPQPVENEGQQPVGLVVITGCPVGRQADRMDQPDQIRGLGVRPGSPGLLGAAQDVGRGAAHHAAAGREQL